jgi:caffeoyl-CoA O-methyltransferase
MSLSYLPFNDELYHYMLAQRSDANDPLLEALRRETKSLGDIANMAISPDQCSFMSLLVALTGAKWAVEVGTFTGSSSISIARSLAPGGKLICFDQEFKWTSIARRYWAKAGVLDRIELKLGNARDLLQRFRPSVQLDFVFIDADKEGYDFYYETLLPMVRTGGLIVLDNMLRGGQVVDPMERKSPGTRSIDQLNRKLAQDPRIQAVLTPIADGLFLCRKR